MIINIGVRTSFRRGAAPRTCRTSLVRALTPAFQVWGLGFRVQSSGFRVQGLGFRDWVLVFKVECSGFRVQVAGFRVER